MRGWKGLVGLHEQGSGGGGSLGADWHSVLSGARWWGEAVVQGLVRVLSGAGVGGGMSRKTRGGGRRWGASGNDAAPSPTSPHVS